MGIGDEVCEAADRRFVDREYKSCGKRASKGGIKQEAFVVMVRGAKGAVKLHLSLDEDNLMPTDAYLSAGNGHVLHGMTELYGELGTVKQ
jgi:hypothetical protein